ncbi:hypothetical protein SKAU_G00025540 [Synaphobranchus kaupii]|uniref:dual-specificity kinase n=1 Tax=Synaphobranchus kaupii TaxID=118154 RepID=A0A9Q1JCM8_SYNKA|nr:hypothetical protein SKAU_G00025540 [Synaphobranchus kaupii]
MFPEINTKSTRPDVFPHPQRFPADVNRLGSSRPYQQKLGTGVGTLPQLEAPIKQVVNNAKVQHQTDSILPHITSKGTQNSYQTQQEERQRVSQFPTRFSSSTENTSESIGTKSLSNKLEKEKSSEGLRLPMSPTEALQNFQERLTEFEQEEITDYSEIWYLGLETKKIEGSQGTPQNSGYDDEHGSYIKVLHDHIGYRFEVLEVIGKGSFGQVLKCLDHKTNELVAIKVIRNKKRFHHQALVELKILDAVRRKDRDNYHNVIHMKEYFYFRNHLCISFELLGVNLYELIKKNNFQGFSLALVRRFTHALLKCLQMLHREKIIHCDLKPENILLAQKGQGSIKVLTLGPAVMSSRECTPTSRVVSIALQRSSWATPYSMAIDMWSLGCILAELYTGYPLFPGESEVEQIACIMELLGLPPNDFVQTASRKRGCFSGNPRNITNSKGRKRRPNSKDMASVLKTSDPQFLDFLKRCLMWDPAKRMTPDEAMQHEWIQDLRFHKIRPKTRLVKKPGEHSSITDNNKVANNRTAEKVVSDGLDKIKRENSGKGVKMTTAERLRPIGASAEEETCEGGARDVKEKLDAGGERPVHIVIKPQLEPGTDMACQEQAQCLPPII